MTDEDRADRGATTTIETSRGGPATITAFEVTASMVASDFVASGGADFVLPEEMLGTIERIWQDKTFTWPTSISVLAIDGVVDGDGAVKSRISVLGSGWAPGTPVSLRFENAFGEPGDRIELPSAEASETGFFGADVTFATLPRSSGEWATEADRPLLLVAEQQVDGEARSARQGPLPAHTVWRWVR